MLQEDKGEIKIRLLEEYKQIMNEVIKNNMIEKGAQNRN